MLQQKLTQLINSKKNNFTLRKQIQNDTTDSVHIITNKKKYLSFSTNNYLGLAHHPDVINACSNALKTHGVGSGSAYLITGYSSLHHELEEKLAEFLGYPRVLLLSSGYMANMGLLNALFSKNDLLLADKLSHASLIDGCLSSQANFYRYPHCNLTALEKICLKPAENKTIITEGLFGMDGTIAPLDEIVLLAKRHKTSVIVDDAHGMGILGKRGRGSLEHFQLGNNDIDILTGSLGKAFGSYGAYVASSNEIIEYLLQQTRTYHYTTAIPPAIAAASIASLKIIQEENWRRDQLIELINYFKNCALQMGITTQSMTAIQPIIVGTNLKSLTISEKLFDKNIIVKAIRPPTVPQGTARLRITLTVEHTKQQIDYLLESLNEAIKNS